MHKQARHVGHIATAINRAYMPWCATALLSCVQASPDVDVRIELIYDSDVGESDRADFTRMLEAVNTQVRFHPVDVQRLSGLPEPVAAHGGHISCARLILPETIPDVDRCLYLDADTLTVSSIAPLFSLLLDDVPLGGVLNVVAPWARPRLLGLGLPEPLRYLNSGVLLMNLEHMRRHNATEALLSYVQEDADSLLWVDQDALNVVFDGEWLELHPRWNAQNSFWNWRGLAAETLGREQLDAATTDPGILHFEGPLLAKPWHYLSNHTYREQYRNTLAQTPWGVVELEDRTLATRVLIHLPWEARISAYLRLVELRRLRSELVERTRQRIFRVPDATR